MTLVDRGVNLLHMGALNENDAIASTCFGAGCGRRIVREREDECGEYYRAVRKAS